MTIQVLENFGIKVGNSNYTRFTITGNQKYKATIFDVESDWSSGAFLLVAGTINGDVTIKGLSPGSRQSDKAILTALDKAGARMDITGDSISIKKSALSAFEFDATESPDLFPPLVTLASYSKGVSEIIGVSRLTYKESNRAETLREEFSRLGIDVKISGDLMLVTGGKVTGAHVNSHSDHRIAMAMAVAGLGADSRVYIKDSQCVAKSYPDFFKDLVKLGAVIYQTE